MSSTDDQKSRAVELLAEGKRSGEVASAVGVRRETVWRWTQDKDFARELADRISTRVNTAERRLRAQAIEAVEVVRVILGGRSRKSAAGQRVQLAAALAVLDRCGITAPAKTTVAPPPTKRELQGRVASLVAVRSGDDGAA
jgi:hypothetical protein